MTTGFQINGIDWDDKFARRDIFTQGGLWIWGRNNSGQLGTNNITHRSSPVQTVSGGTNWKLATGGRYYSVGIKTDGSLWSWGSNVFGQLGDNTTTNRSSPVQTVAAGNNWKIVASGQYYTGAIKTDGTLWLWGLNSVGQLGTNNTTFRSSPVQTVSGGTNWKYIDFGNEHTLSIKTDQTLWSWGFNTSGQLGLNTSTNVSSPVQIITGGTWKTISAGQNNSAGIKTDGSLWLWGAGNIGQLGNNSTTDRSSPVQTVAGGNNWKLISINSGSAAGIKTDGTLWTWGANNFGQLGDNTSTSRSSPVQTISAGTNWKYASSTGSFVAAIKLDGSLWLWGRNSYGQLGDNTTTNRSSPVQTVSSGINWKIVGSGTYHTLAVREDYY